MLGTRQESPEETPWGCLSGVAGPPQVSIDPNGNLTSKTEGSDNWTYEWNARNELTRVTKNSVEQARFAYDPLGRRVEKIAAGVTTSHTYDGEDIVREVRGGSMLKYVHGPGTDEPLALDDGGSISYFHADGLGSIVRTTSAAGAVTLTRQYDAWGSLEVGANEPGYAFTGREWDVEDGLYYYRARSFDAKLGRFISEDAIGYRDGPNLYRYARNNPTNLTDPSGRLTNNQSACLSFFIFAFGTFGFAAGGAAASPGGITIPLGAGAGGAAGATAGAAVGMLVCQIPPPSCLRTKEPEGPSPERERDCWAAYVACVKAHQARNQPVTECSQRLEECLDFPDFDVEFPL